MMLVKEGDPVHDEITRPWCGVGEGIVVVGDGGWGRCVLFSRILQYFAIC